MHLPFGLWIITSSLELGFCVIAVDPVGVASRSGFIGIIGQVVYNGFQPVTCFGLIGGCSLGRC
jgi:hypothetical protein